MTEPKPVTKDKTVAEIMDGLESEIKTSMLNPKYGIRSDSLTAFAGTKTWKINPTGHTLSVRHQLLELMEKSEQRAAELEKSGTRYQGILEYEKTTRKILDIGLVHFDYDMAADDPQIGPHMLGRLAGELQIFLVENGGREGTQYLQMLQKLDTLNRYRSSKDSSTNTKSSPDTPSESDPSSSSTE